MEPSVKLTRMTICNYCRRNFMPLWGPRCERSSSSRKQARSPIPLLPPSVHLFPTLPYFQQYPTLPSRPDAVSQILTNAHSLPPLLLSQPHSPRPSAIDAIKTYRSWPDFPPIFTVYGGFKIDRTCPASKVTRMVFRHLTICL